MLTTLKNLGLAMINATLILIVLCLFLTWKITNRVDNLASNFAQNLNIVAPLREDLQGATKELAALRSDLAALKTQSGDVSSATLQRLQDRMSQTQGKLETAQQSVRDLTQAPAQLIDHAIETAADEFAQRAKDIRGCVPPET